MVLNPFSAFGGNDAPPQQGDDAVVRPPPGALHVGEPADVLDRLPAEAQDALTGLREKVDDLHADALRATDRMFDASRAFAEAKNNFLAISDPNVAMRMGGRTLSEDSPEYVRRQNAMEKAQARHREAIGRKETADARYQTQKRLLTKILEYLDSTRGALVAAAKPVVKFPAADRLVGEVEKVRGNVATLRADRHEIQSAAFPSSEIKKRAAAEIEELARLGKPNVIRLVDEGPAAGVAWPDYEAVARGSGLGVRLPGDTGHTRTAAAPHLPLLAFLFKRQILAALNEAIDELADDSHALSTEQRQEKLKEIDNQILASERVEAVLVAASGGAIDHRSDVDPRAVLGLDGPPPED